MDINYTLYYHIYKILLPINYFYNKYILATTKISHIIDMDWLDITHKLFINGIW